MFLQSFGRKVAPCNIDFFLLKYQQPFEVLELSPRSMNNHFDIVEVSQTDQMFQSDVRSSSSSRKQECDLQAIFNRQRFFVSQLSRT